MREKESLPYQLFLQRMELWIKYCTRDVTSQRCSGVSMRRFLPPPEPLPSEFRQLLRLVCVGTTRPTTHEINGSHNHGRTNKRAQMSSSTFLAVTSLPLRPHPLAPLMSHKRNMASLAAVRLRLQGSFSANSLHEPRFSYV